MKKSYPTSNLGYMYENINEIFLPIKFKSFHNVHYCWVQGKWTLSHTPAFLKGYLRVYNLVFNPPNVL